MKKKRELEQINAHCDEIKSRVKSLRKDKITMEQFCDKVFEHTTWIRTYIDMLKE